MKSHELTAKPGAAVRAKTQIALSLAVLAGLYATGAQAQSAGTTPAPAACDPYTKISCLDDYLGTGFWNRLVRYYELEWGKDGAPADDKAPPGRRDNFPPQAQPSPPMPFTEWPYGGGELLGATRTGSIDSPLMVAISDTSVGKWMNDQGFQFYGWVNVGGNISTNSVKPGGNAPAAYLYTPNSVTLDQAVVYLDRFPDTVQKEKIDWGLRLSAIYGENYRYTTEYGFFSNNYLVKNSVNGFDSPMFYGELFFPGIGEEGLEVRAGRYIAIPDIEAQLAPNNYMYTHSMTYAFDNYTNEGLIGILGVNKNLFLTAGVEMGTDTAWKHWNETMRNPSPSYNGVANPYFPSATMKVDPGAMPSFVGSIRYQTDDSKDDISLTVNGINSGQWGYNNLQWVGLTYYHTFDEHWHIATEAYHMGEKNTPNVNYVYPAGPSTLPAAINGWDTPFSFMVNGPNGAKCKSTTVATCSANVIAAVAYLNYSPDHMNNFSIRPEYFNDQQGQRTGQAGIFRNLAFGWQYWFSPQVEVRPEINFMHFTANSANGGNPYAFNGNPVAGPGGIAPNKSSAVILAGDIIWHF